MSRPNIVRADTIDLQDQDAPSAAEHTKPVTANGIAPHQAAQYQHVQEERHSEEQTLANAWNMGGQKTGAAEPAEGEEKPNGAEAGEGESAENAAAADGESDDDMLDRISSSPSIDDGQFNRLSSALALRESMDVPRTPQHHPTTEATFNQSPSLTPDSSPFVDTPQYLPLRLRISNGEEFASRLSSTVHTPDSSPLLATATFGRFVSVSSLRQSVGKYAPELEFDRSQESEELCEAISEGPFGGVTSAARNAWVPQRSSSVNAVAQGNAFSGVNLKLEPPETNQRWSLASIDLLELLEVPSPIEDSSLQPPSSPTKTDESWESDSTEDWTIEDCNSNGTDPFFNLDKRFIDSGWGGECLRDTEDIDFEFVYALHTFVATVEGQANATKGDTMVLLDDSNSYWWLVRVVKDSSIGYLPAEHIETPTERLARLNKHRNIDLSQTMLGDNPEKSKNPLKKAMRRRNAKTVQFAAPTYVEASDYDYSSDEDEPGVIDPYAGVVQQEEPERGQPAEVEERNAPEEANVHATRRHSGDLTTAHKTSTDSIGKTSIESKRSSIEDPQLSPRLVDRTEAAPLKSRKGTPRNTDSFLKDDTIETRKISLTPGLLRDDNTSKTSSSESTRNDSMESLVKTPSPQDEKKPNGKDKKKEKKPGMLSGLFKSKKKDKTRANSKDDGEQSDAEKASLDMARNSPRGGSPTSTAPSVDRVAATGATVDSFAIQQQQQAQLQPQARSKLQKPQPIITTSTSVPASTPAAAPAVAKTPDGGFVAELPGSDPAFEMATGQEDDLAIQRQLSVESAAQDQPKVSPLSPIANILRTGSTDARPRKAKRAKQRVELDDFDSPGSEKGVNPFLEQEDRERGSSQDDDRLSESPVEITSGTFMHGTDIVHIPQPVDDEEEGDGEEGGNANDSASSSPSLVERPSTQQSENRDVRAESTTSTREVDDDDATPTVTAAQSPAPPSIPVRPAPQQPPSRDQSVDSVSSVATNSTATADTPISASSPPQNQLQPPTWNDNGLRAWLDAEEVKDMLCIIHSKHDVVPASQDHPMMKDLFVEQRKGVNSMMGELDGLLGSLLQKRGISFT